VQRYNSPLKRLRRLVVRSSAVSYTVQCRIIFRWSSIDELDSRAIMVWQRPVIKDVALLCADSHLFISCGAETDRNLTA